MLQDTQEVHGPVTILHTRGGHYYSDEQPQRVHEDMALASFDLLGSIKPVVTNSIRRFDGLRPETYASRMPRKLDFTGDCGRLGGLFAGNGKSGS
jgi:hypothetical protein